ncbi:MAG: cation transporter [Candidatus Omnitrophica bacterium]|nr:cation transporter [Candidatus Omnitrophota bacterium]
MHNHDHYRFGKKSVILIIVINMALFAIKFLSGIVGRSQALIADSFHTASDALTSVAVLIGFVYASTPADPHHPYGHGKAESVATKIISLTLIVLGFKVMYDSARVLISQELYQPHQLTIWVVLLSIVVKEIQFRYALRCGKKIQSTSLIADAWHHRSDMLSSVAALIGIVGARLGFKMLDPIAGIVVGIFVAKIGFGIFHTAFDELLDGALPKELTGGINKLALETEGVKRVTVLKARKLGLDILVDMTIEVDKDITVEEAHIITAKVRRRILKDIDNTKDVMIHVEPYKG